MNYETTFIIFVIKHYEVFLLYNLYSWKYKASYKI